MYISLRHYLSSLSKIPNIPNNHTHTTIPMTIINVTCAAGCRFSIFFIFMRPLFHPLEILILNDNKRKTLLKSHSDFLYINNLYILFYSKSKKHIDTIAFPKRFSTLNDSMTTLGSPIK